MYIVYKRVELIFSFAKNRLWPQNEDYSPHSSEGLTQKKKFHRNFIKNVPVVANYYGTRGCQLLWYPWLPTTMVPVVANYYGTRGCQLLWYPWLPTFLSIFVHLDHSTSLNLEWEGLTIPHYILYAIWLTTNKPPPPPSGNVTYECKCFFMHS